MKRFFALFAALLLLTQAACVSNVKPRNTPAPTEEATVKATEAPTAIPPAVPTAVPTAEPIVFPTPGRLGNLVNGEAVLPDGMEYFVLDGESNIRYVYDRYGELVTSFNAAEDGWLREWSVSGIYGKYGIPYGYMIAQREKLVGNYICFGDRLFEYEWIHGFKQENRELVERHDYILTGLWDAELEKHIEFEPECIWGLGEHGGILPIDGKLVVINGMMKDENGERAWEYEATVIDENGGFIKQLNMEYIVSAENIIGVLGNRYLLTASDGEPHPLEKGGGYNWYEKCSIFTLDGECVMTDCWASGREFCSSEYFVGKGLFYSNCFVNAQGDVFDSDLNPLYTLPEDTDLNQVNIMPTDKSSVFHSYNCGYTVEQSGVYAGVKDEAGNWVFRIYNPMLASDSQRNAQRNEE